MGVAQHRCLLRHHDAESVDVTPQTPREIFHVSSGLRQRRFLVQHESHRLRRGHRLIAPPDRLVSDANLPAGRGALTVRLSWSQRKAHDATPVRFKPSWLGFAVRRRLLSCKVSDLVATLSEP